jgi:hypothetical protein
MTEVKEDYMQMLDYLDELYYKTEDEAEKKKFGAYYDNLSVHLEEFTKAKFANNDKFYKKAVHKLKKAKTTGRKHLETQTKIRALFRYLSQLLEQIDALLYN